MNKRLNFLIIILVGIGLIFIYVTYSSDEDGGDAVIAPLGLAGAVGESSSGGSEVLKILVNLKSIELDVTFFENEIFRGLIDFSVELMPEEVGRPNPFAPLE